MNSFFVESVIDGDTFIVKKGWTWRGQRGDRIRPTGYDAPEMHEWSGPAAKQTLTNLILGKYVEIGNAYTIDRGRLVCDVYFNGRNLADYFPAYKT